MLVYVRQNVQLVYLIAVSPKSASIDLIIKLLEALSGATKTTHYLLQSLISNFFRYLVTHAPYVSVS